MMAPVALLCIVFTALASLLPPKSLSVQVSALHLTPRNIDRFLLPSYDYIIVGGGTAGLVVANRLSEDENVTVLVVEAGQLTDPESLVTIPGLVGYENWSKHEWNLTTMPQEFLDGRSRQYNLGRVIGGSSVINGLCWTRGPAADYNAWEQLGNPGWGWSGLLPYFKKIENYEVNLDRETRDRLGVRPDMSSHNTGGPIDVAYPGYIYDQSYNVLDGLRQLGIPLMGDPNAGNGAGAMFLPSSMSPYDHTRSDARTGYYDPAISRPNLHVATDQTVLRLLVGDDDLENPGHRWIDGVLFSTGPRKQVREVMCKREVILAAGGVYSAVLLQLSGIGPSNVLRDLGIPVSIDLPGVGNNFQDHPMVSVVYGYTDPYVFSSHDIHDSPDTREWVSDQYHNDLTGPWTAPLVNVVAFPALKWLTPNWRKVISDAASEQFDSFLAKDLAPSVKKGYKAQRQILLDQYARDDIGVYELLSTSWGEISVANQKPLSRGTVRPSANDIFSKPAVDPRYCSDPTDCRVILLGLQLNNRLIETASMQELLPTVEAPFDDPDDIPALSDGIRERVRTEFHPSGATAMMPLDLGGVVDPKLVVYGTYNLRVVDAGIMPLVPAAHTQAIVYAIAEKAADIIKAARMSG